MSKTDIDRAEGFNLDNPELPKWVSEQAMASGRYPYEDRMKRKHYEDTLKTLQLELVKLQTHVHNNGERFILIFEGRDAAGKGGTIARFRQFMNHRSAPVVALPKPTDREMGEWYFQRYVDRFPTAGEFAFFDRSWYNRAGVEPVMGFCTPEQTDEFLAAVPPFEHLLISDGAKLFKFWLNIGREMQIKRFHDRRHDPLKAWKISPIDLQATAKWDDYTDARDRMIAASHTPESPWVVIRGNDKRRSRIAAIRHVLASVDYDGKDESAIGEHDPQIIGLGPNFLNRGVE